MIFVYNPYVSAGGGQRIQGAFIKILNSATDAGIHTFTNLRNFMKHFFTCDGKRVVILQSIYSWRSLILVIFLQWHKLKNSLNIDCIIIPRGDRLPLHISDKSVKSAVKKYFYTKLFFLFSRKMYYIFSSKTEADHYIAAQDVQNYFIIPDPSFYPHDFNVLPDNIEVQKFIFLGRLSFEKNINFIVDLFKQEILINLNLQLYLYLISNNDEVLRLQKSLAGYQNIHVCAPLKNTSQVFQVLQSSVVLNPSYYESFGLVPLEAIAAGAGFISSPVGEWQADNSAGRVIDLERDAWTRAILDYHTNGIKNDKLDRVNTLRKYDPSEVKLKWTNVMKGFFQ